MSESWPGGIISKTPPTVTPPTNGEGGSASGVWDLHTVLENERVGRWPKCTSTRSLYEWGGSPSGRNSLIVVSSPVQIGALTTWCTIASGSTQTLAIRTDGTLWSWGRNTLGALGHNNTIARSSPVQVGALTNWCQVSTDKGGVGQMEGAALAVKTDGTLWGWGHNDTVCGGEGLLGVGTTINISSPVQVGTTPATGFSKTAIGNFHALAIVGGFLVALGGRGDWGNLGTNTTDFRSAPTFIGSLSGWTDIAAGQYHSLAIRNNSLWSWGFNGCGQLGLNDRVSKSSPTQVGSLTDWAAVAASLSGSISVKTDGTLWSWGYNSFGHLGHNDQVNRSSPVQVGALTNWCQVSMATENTLAVKTDGTLWSWGNAQAGRLGDGTTICRSSPVQVGALTSWCIASAGRQSGAGITRVIN